MYSAYFKATIYEQDRDSIHAHEEEVHGVITGVVDFKDAMERIESRFGDTLVKISIELFDTEMMTFSPEEGEKIYKVLEDNVF